MKVVGTSIIVAAALVLGGGAWANATNTGGQTGLQGLSTASLEEATADEPIHLIVSLPEQRVKVYVGGKPVANSPVSTGRKGHATPTGIFSILHKKRHHRSNIYSRAPMPFMQRLTWSGIALHASNQVPDYPASHGCVRLPPKFARKLFGFTEIGAHVIITGGEATPVAFSHPNLFQPLQLPIQAAAGVDIAVDGSRERAVDAPSTIPASAEAMPAGDIDAKTGATEARARNLSPVRILVTRRTGRELMRDVQTLLEDLGHDPGKIDGWMGKDTGGAVARFQESRDLQKTGAMSEELVRELYRAAGKGKPPTGHIYVRQDFAPVFDAPITIADPENPLGAHLFTAMSFEEDATDVQWLAVTLNDSVPETTAPEMAGEETATAQAPGTAKQALSRIKIPAPVRRRISAMLTPGSSLAISDHGISRETTDKGSDFVVLMR